MRPDARMVAKAILSRQRMCGAEGTPDASAKSAVAGMIASGWGRYRQRHNTRQCLFVDERACRRRPACHDQSVGHADSTVASRIILVGVEPIKRGYLDLSFPGFLMPWGTGAYDPYTIIPISLCSAGIYRLIGINSKE